MISAAVRTNVKQQETKRLMAVLNFWITLWTKSVKCDESYLLMSLHRSVVIYCKKSYCIQEELYYHSKKVAAYAFIKLCL